MTAVMEDPTTTWTVTVICDRCSRRVSMSGSGTSSTAALAKVRGHLDAYDGWTVREQKATGKTLDLCQRCSELQEAGWL